VRDGGQRVEPARDDGDAGDCVPDSGAPGEFEFEPAIIMPSSLFVDMSVFDVYGGWIGVR